MIVGIDAGNYRTKICTPFGVNSFYSDIGEYRDRKLKSTFGDDDMIWEYKGERGFAGTLAKYECEYGGSRKGGSKAHNDALMRILLAIHKYVHDDLIQLVVGQPIDSHVEGEKNKIIDMLLGSHEITVNNETRKFFIKDVRVAAEGASALISNPKQDLIRIIDVGSATINFATLHNMRYVDRDSFTASFGMETVKNKDVLALTRRILLLASEKWQLTDEIHLTGGAADKLIEYLSNEFPNIQLLKPVVNFSQPTIVNSTYANAIGFYRIAKKLYERV